MKKLISIFIVALIANGAGIAFAASSKDLAFIDPKHDATIPVYQMDENGRRIKTPITELIPGDFFSIKQVRKDGWYVIRGKNIDGTEMDLLVDPATVKNKDGVHLAYTAARNARKIRINADKADGTNEPGLDTAVCDIDPGHCFQFGGGDEIEVEDAVLTLTTNGSMKPKWRNYYRARGPNSQEPWWTDSDDTSRVDGSWSVLEDPKEQKEKDCPPNGTEPLDQKQANNLEATIDRTVKTAGVSMAETAHEFLGSCLPMTGDYHNNVVRTIANKKTPTLAKQIRAADGSVQVVPTTTADWVSMDALARTLYAEMAGCFSKGSQYPEAVAKVITNRVDFAKKYPKMGARFLQQKDNEIRGDITNIVFKDKQFAVWSRGDAARQMAMCPPVSSDKDFWAGRKPPANELKIWKEAVRIASEVVLTGESFRKRTSDMKALYYTSNFELSKADYKPIQNATIGGKAVPMSRCVQLWTAKDIAAAIPGHSRFFHPLIQKALFQASLRP